jgi:hypothetical protein
MESAKGCLTALLSLLYQCMIWLVWFIIICGVPIVLIWIVDGIPNKKMLTWIVVVIYILGIAFRDELKRGE